MVTETERVSGRPRLVAAIWLGGCVVAVGAGLAATVRPDAATWFGVRGPLCPLGGCLGERHCPGCGLVRSVSATLQGEVELAFRCHPGGIAIAALLILAAALHFDILRRGLEGERHRQLRRLGRRAFAIAVLLGWLLRYLTPTI